MTRSNESVDYAILGGGMAGLTVASALARQLPADRKAVVVDPRVGYSHDRTFCFWDVAPIDADAAIRHRWSRWSVRAGGREYVASSDKYSYCYVPGDAFYDHTVRQVESAPNIELRLGTRAGVVEQTEQGTLRVQTSADPIDAKWVFDTRPSRALVEASQTLQHFVGWHICFDEPVFDPTTVTLMDFDVSQEHGLHFMYVLPFSEYEAVVESTFFSPTVLPVSTYEAYIRAYLLERSGASLSQLERAMVVRTERGVVPMTPATVAKPDAPGWHLLGTPGGFVRPATGYCFHATGRWAQNQLDWLLAPTANVPSLRGGGLNWLDSVLLSYLDRAPEKAPEIFLQLFERVQPDALIRFLSDLGTAGDVLSVMRAMPAWPFIQEAMHLGLSSPVEVREPALGSM